MEISDILELPNNDLMKVIRAELKEDPERLEKQIELFKEWLRCEPHLPKDIDELLIQNFVRQCKCNLEKAKKKFEKYLSIRVKMHKYYDERNLNGNFFDDIMLHRQIVPCAKLTAEGYRIGFARLHEDISKFNFERLFQYALIWMDLMLVEDTCAGYIGVMDLDNLSPQHIGKVNIKLLMEAINLIYNVAPHRIKSMHFLNVPYIPETIIILAKKILSEKMVNRMYGHKDPKELKEHIPDHILPVEYGGCGESMDIVADRIRDTFITNKKWLRKTENLKLQGAIPSHKRELYSFEDFEMGGSFRKLSID